MKNSCEIFSYSDVNAVGFFLRHEFAFIDKTDPLYDDKIKFMGKYTDSYLMHKRLPRFDDFRLDKFPLKKFEQYRPRHMAARQLKDLMKRWRADPIKQMTLFNEIKKGNERVKNKMPDKTHDSD